VNTAVGWPGRGETASSLTARPGRRTLRVERGPLRGLRLVAVGGWLVRLKAACTQSNEEESRGRGLMVFSDLVHPLSLIIIVIPQTPLNQPPTPTQPQPSHHSPPGGAVDLRDLLPQQVRHLHVSQRHE